MQFAIYRRVSTKKQTEGFSLHEQLERLVELTATYDATYEDFCDPGISGEALEERPKLMELLSRLSEFDALVVTDDSRLARDELASAYIRDKLRGSNTRLITPSGEVDLNDPTDRFTSGVMALANQLEQGLRTHKMVAGLRQAALAGYWTGGPAPYGYDIADASDRSRHKQLAINEEEASILRLVYDLIVNQGHTTYSAAAHLNAHGYRTHRGQQWRHPNLCWQLRQSHLTGSWTYNQGDDPIEVAIPAIFTEDEWATLQGAIKGRSRVQSKHQLYPLTERQRQHLFCPCGGNFHGMWRKEKDRGYYTCANNNHSWGEDRCPYTPRTYQSAKLEKAVMDEVRAVLTDPDYLRQLAELHITQFDQARNRPADLPALRRHLGRLDQERVRMVRQLARDDQLHADALSAALADIDTERDELSQVLRQAQTHEQTRQLLTHVPERIPALVSQAQEKLANPTVELMAQIFDVLEIDLHRHEDGTRFEGTGSIPILEEGDNPFGEVGEGGPQHRAPHRRLSNPTPSLMSSLTFRTPSNLTVSQPVIRLPDEISMEW